MTLPVCLPPPFPLQRESPALKYKRGYKYQVIERHSLPTPFIGYEWDTDYYQMHRDGVLTIKQLYAWDGPSGPALDTEDTMIPSLYHDALCQAMNEGLLPRECHRAVDLYFTLLNRRARMFAVRRWYFHRAVRLNAKLRLVGPEQEITVRFPDGPENTYWLEGMLRIQQREPACICTKKGEV